MYYNYSKFLPFKIQVSRICSYIFSFTFYSDCNEIFGRIWVKSLLMSKLKA